jgi:acylaminoacyl-peptidase
VAYHHSPSKCFLYPAGSKLPFEAIFVSCKDSSHKPTILVLHGGPHSVSVSSYSKTSAFLASLGFNLLIVNYRGTPGFGEEALQSLPGKVGSQDVQDCLTALDYVIEGGLIDASKVAVIGISHGGFLTTHLIGQVSILTDFSLSKEKKKKNKILIEVSICFLFSL